MVMTMIKKIMAVFMVLCAVAFAGLVETTLAGGNATEVSLSTLATTHQTGLNTYVLLNSTNASDTQNITLNYMTSAYAQKSVTLALTGVTQFNTSGGSNYAYVIASNTTANPFNLDLNNWTLTSNGKNATVKCANYTNVYHVEGTVSYTTDMNATSSSNLANAVVDGKARLSGVEISNFVTTKNTYFSTIWYYYNPPLTQNVYVSSSFNVLPQGEKFLSNASFTVVSNLNNSWKNNSNHSEGYVNGVITITPDNSDNRTYSVTSNETYPVLSEGYVIIPSANLVQNKRVIVSDLDASKCVNATLSKTGGSVSFNTSLYTQSGTKTSGITDIAYLYSVKLASAATGSVTVKDASVRTLYTVPIGSTTPTDNGASMMCLNSNGCAVTSLMYGGDGLWKMSSKVYGKDGSNTTKMSVWQSAGSGFFGVNLIRWYAGERLVFYGTPAVNNTAVSIYYEGG